MEKVPPKCTLFCIQMRWVNRLAATDTSPRNSISLPCTSNSPLRG